MKSYRKKPVVISAVHVDGDLIDQKFEELGGPGCTEEYVTKDGKKLMVAYFPYHIDIHTLEGIMRVDMGDYIITGVNGEKYPCKPDIFKATYDPVDDEMPTQGQGLTLDELIEQQAEFDFGLALSLMQEGIRVARKGWNGKGMFAFYQKAYPDGIPINKNTSEATGLPEGTLCRFRPYLMLKTAQDDFAHWVPSTSDILATDWVIV